MKPFEHIMKAGRLEASLRKLNLAEKLDGDFYEALGKLTVFESLRETHVRGPAPYGPAVLAASDEAYAHIRELCTKHIGPL